MSNPEPRSAAEVDDACDVAFAAWMERSADLIRHGDFRPAIFRAGFEARRVQPHAALHAAMVEAFQMIRKAKFETYPQAAEKFHFAARAYCAAFVEGER